MATISGTSRPGYVWDSTDNVWYPIGTGVHTHDYIPNTIADAKGDLVTATADNTPARLAVGNNGETLVADSSTSTGLRYQATPIVNPAINGAFDIFQRGTSTTVNNAWAFVADRWMGYRATSCTYSRQATGDTTNLPNIQYCMRMARSAGDTATGTMYLQQSVETANAIPFAGQTVTFSFWARKGADYSATSSLLSVFLYTGTGTDQNIKDGYTGSATPINTSVTLTTTWQRFQVTGTIAATATEFSPYFSRGTAGTAGAADYCDITGVMVSIGSIAPSFQRTGGTIQGELAACQRYFNRIVDGSLNAYSGFNVATVASTTRADTVNTIPINLRTSPTIRYRAVGDFVAGGQAVTAINSYSGSGKYININFTVGSGLTTGQCVRVELNNAATGYLDYDAEL